MKWSCLWLILGFAEPRSCWNFEILGSISEATSMLPMNVGDGLCWWQFLDLSGQFHILMIDLLHWKSHQHHKTVVFKKSTTSRCSQNDCSRFRKDRQIRQQQRIMATNIAFTFGNITRIGSYAERRDIFPIMMRLIKMVLAVDLFPYNSATHFIENKIWHFETC